MPSLLIQVDLTPLLLRAVQRAGWRDGELDPEAPVRLLARPPRDEPSGTWLWLPSRRPEAQAIREAVQRGAYEVIPLDAPNAVARLGARLRELADREPLPLADPRMVTDSSAAQRTLKQLLRAARTSMPVLLTGETGTGKELAARLIHERSARAKGPFIPINCAAIPNELMEGELFGYVKGAFSGATRGFDGQLFAASGGTVFLDEIDDTPLSLQIKLLRVLEDHVVNRLGESAPRKVDFRVVAATNRDLKTLIARGVFGQDVYERLAIVRVSLTPLRARLEDLPALAHHFIERFYQEEPQADARAASRVRTLSPDALSALAAYPWPGNIRELRNALYEALVYKRSGTELLLSDLPRRLLRRSTPSTRTALVEPSAVQERMERGAFNLRRELESLERTALEVAMERAGGNAAKAARLLGEVGRGHARDPGGTVRAMQKRLR